ncbi:MAG: hypothetical protein WCE30_03785 [Mycobacterium sp.]
MNSFWKFSPWISKAILLPSMAILTMVGVRNLARPGEQAAERGLAFTDPLGATIYRVGFAGFPLGCAAFIAYCLRTNQRTLTGLIFSALFNGVVLAVRIFGMAVDSTVQRSRPLVKGEIVVVVISLVGITIEIGRPPHHLCGPLYP